jgi:ATP-dependent exoDNAse (exonuclease V) beta subunit
MTEESKSILLPTLKNKYSHPRDENILFDEPTHKYTILTDIESKYTSVTTWNHTHFPHFDADDIITKMMNGKNWNSKNKYWGQTPEQIKDLWKKNGESVSGAGTDLHFDIECFMNYELPPSDHPITHQHLLDHYYKKYQDSAPPNESEEWGFFLEFAKAFPDLKPYRTEWTVYNEDLKLSGSIDMVYENPEDDTLSIYDWKRAKEIAKTSGFNKYATTECINYLPDTNFWHYSLQLNTYKAILEAKYGKKIRDLYLVRLHPNNTKKTFDLIKCADLSEEIRELFEYRKEQLKQLKQ